MPDQKEPWYKTIVYFVLGLIGVISLAVLGIIVETVVTWYLTNGF